MISLISAIYNKTKIAKIKIKPQEKESSESKETFGSFNLAIKKKVKKNKLASASSLINIYSAK